LAASRSAFFSDKGKNKSARAGSLTAAAKAVLATDRAVSEWRSLHEIDPLLVAAVVLAEDRHFWRHRGIDWSAVRAAAIKNVEQRRIRFGASTIPMQVARMLRGWSKRSYARKLGESLLALWLVARYQRESLLEVYLNLVPVVSGTRGLVAGSFHLIGSDPCQLSVFDATLLAAAVSVCPETAPGSTARFATWLYDKQMRLVEDLMESGHINAHEAAAASAQVAAKWGGSNGELTRAMTLPTSPWARLKSVGWPGARARHGAIRWALAQVGTTEHSKAGGAANPDGRVETWLREFGMTGVGWCGGFVGYGLRVVAGISEIDTRVVWVPHVLEDAFVGRLGWDCLVHPRDALPGDVALFTWDGSRVPQHIGFVIANDRVRSVMLTVEGNTTRDGTGDQSHGGGVFVRQRSYDVIVICARPMYPSARAELFRVGTRVRRPG
jgi:hypothetical protein